MYVCVCVYVGVQSREWEPAVGGGGVESAQVSLHIPEQLHKFLHAHAPGTRAPF